jgi:MFS family permease
MNLNRPKVVMWFKVYCWVLAVCYLLTMLFSMIFFFVSPEELEMPAVVAKITGMIMLLLGLGLFIASLMGIFLTPKPWVWVYCLVLICLGMTSACFLPACIPLLLFWLKQETKSYYGRQNPTGGTA